MHGGRPPQPTGPNSRQLDHPDPPPPPGAAAIERVREIHRMTTPDPSGPASRMESIPYRTRARPTSVTDPGPTAAGGA